MTEIFYRFNIGDFKCLIIRDGLLSTPDGEKLELHCLCIQTGKHTVLIDSGFGTSNPETGKIIPNLLSAGISASEVDTLVISHSHPDHIGGIVNKEGALNFPKALHYISQKEWDYCLEYCKPDSRYTNPNEFIRQSTLNSITRNVLPLKKRIILLEEESEIVPGINFVSASGHTPGHIAVSVSSGNQHLVTICDLIHDPAEFENPDLYKETHTDPEESNNSKKKVFDEVITPDTLVFVNHFTFPGLGHIKKSGQGWQWQPLKNKTS
jgi:glyoxylase-like metal-dependent hydrolase (beta-lactamase superfamily II)